ncbi:alpha-ketoglutarate-dependent dioxygenase AlkB [Acinetobacter sp. ANC 4470]|uniref:alpha-ketoglutarate-dependent dioxygenase AlkB family protein n=1 Tax=Acinetobacter sp. ANC 4470 TaxID=1977881 RepID=UPI000A3566F0|nr:alpha-ketoglutarate-dependent dioxygenase AlkB [Acinetobacter sp. ANC 4470]OTG68803.1 alpha-ketoglutarate-dependent dioxygenase AlkB [Acinetobacter sp. ANC 4470]
MNFELFAPEAQANVLPCDGVVEDFGLILTAEQSTQYLNYFLKHLAWQQDEVILHGQYYKTERQVAWYGDENYQYHYSGTFKQAHVWNPALFRLKQHIEKLVGYRFNSCLANLYTDGTQAVGWHSDDEPALVSQVSQEMLIASLSFGATRKFSFKHKSKAEKVDLLLYSGQLIVMRGKTQQHWKHALMKSKKIIEPRINLTFRHFF